MANLFPPFDPDDAPRRKRARQLAQIPIRWILPNLVTLLALCAGLTSIRMSIEGRYEWAIALIAIAAFLDGIDGRVARFLKSSSRFGAELEFDHRLPQFRRRPGILLYVWALHDLHSLGWMAVLIFAICAALRLARFNVALDAPEKPDWQSSYFVGVPAPAGAMIVLLPIYMEFVGTPHGFLDGAAGARLYARDRAPHGEPRADLVGQADRPAHLARHGAAALRRGRRWRSPSWSASPGRR